MRALEAIYQRNSPDFLESRLLKISFKKGLFYSHSIVADGFGDIS